MDLQLKEKLFIVGGATSGFGEAIAKALLIEDAYIIAIARSEEKLNALKLLNPLQVEILVGDITEVHTLYELEKRIGKRQVHGMLVNAGGPPAKTFLETTVEDWDNAYKNILKWKVIITKLIIPKMVEQHYGRVVYIESSSVKQPLENLVLSNSLRLAVVGFVKTLSQEIASTGVTLNILAPGSHNTPAIDRVYNKKAEQTGKAIAEIKESAIQQIPVGFLGQAKDFATLALWLLSPSSRYITGQTITVDGGIVKSIFG